MSDRIVIEEPCPECGSYMMHPYYPIDRTERCEAGGSRRVVSGTPIRLCATHEGEVFHVIPGIMRGCYAGNEFKPCSGESVDRILINPGEETE